MLRFFVPIHNILIYLILRQFSMNTMIDTRKPYKFQWRISTLAIQAVRQSVTQSVSLSHIHVTFIKFLSFIVSPSHVCSPLVRLRPCQWRIATLAIQAVHQSVTHLVSQSVPNYVTIAIAIAQQQQQHINIKSRLFATRAFATLLVNYFKKHYNYNFRLARYFLILSMPWTLLMLHF